MIKIGIIVQLLDSKHQMHFHK